MELSVVTLWSDASPVHQQLVQYFLAEAFPVPTRFLWVVNTEAARFQGLLDASAQRLRARGHDVDVTACSQRPPPGPLGKHQHVASLYQLVLPRLQTPLVLTVEDDMLPRAGDYIQAANALAMNRTCGALSALYRSRNNPEAACAAVGPDCWRRTPKYRSVPPIPLRIAFVGAGFALYRTAALRAGAPFRAGFVGPALHGWDANLCLDLRRLGWDVALHGAIRVEHHCPEVLSWCARTGETLA